MFTIKPKKNSKKIFSNTVLIIFSVALISSWSTQNMAEAQTRDCLSTVVTRVDADYNGPVFLDAYWTDRSASSGGDVLNPSELIVGPGEGQSTLAVVFSNRSPLELYAITGYLRLPAGFEPGGTSAEPEAKSYFTNTISKNTVNVSQASYFGKLIEGEVFTLFFDVNITEKAKVGAYLGQVILDYSTPTYVRSCKSALLDVPFILPGKIILDLTTDNKPLTPKAANTVDFIISNKGSSPATGAVLTILSIGDDSSRSSRDSSSSAVTLQSAETELVNLGNNTFNIGTIPANGSTKFSTEIFPEASSGSTVQNISMQIIYGNSYGYKQTELLTTGLVVAPKPSESPIIVSVDTQHEQPVVTAGTVEGLKFEITNSGNKDISDLLATLSGESTEMKIMGKSKWVIQHLAPGETSDIFTDVFASTNLINNPSSFNLELNYISDGEATVETSNVGVFVAGKIDLELYDLQVNNVGDSLYLVGSILNQGSTTGKFANIELLSYPKFSQSNNSTYPEGTDTPRSNGSIPSVTPQYLGDLTDDSSIPFSIPLPFASIPPGEYPFSFKLTYADDLRNFHEIVFDETVKVSKIQNQFQQGQRLGQNNSNFLPAELIVGIIIAVIIISVVVVVKRRKGKARPSDDLDFLLEDKSGPKIES